ncbi:hypothetical protein FE243_05235 [Aliarcobacter thereius]|uniref:Eco57I restriction-modification methylase domain-containing protein n=1 Tax=Aliarcobacter thereius TaxID=544718 RepID=UPI0010FDDB2F|nr:DNA methyltransferase [Aliarcobacter thereius]TLT07248.1 hypothetical protein FE243_05235 [Aliarcobacter thereius]
MFQNSVLKTFNDDEKLVATRWASYQNYKSKVEAIKDFKEEEYQDGFLKDIFESCLGYTLKTTNPSSFNLEREKKNETDSKKADGVFYLNSEIIGVIELKAQDTRNLDKVQQQAFYYLSQHSKAKYVIISNFDELRFYIEKSTAYESFSLFNLTYEEFSKLHLLLAYENIKEEKALKIREKSNKFEQNISKELYKDFSNFRILLFDNLVKNNLSIEKSVLLRLTQKLCDRIIFILFAEDRTLLRANTIKEIREEFINQKFTNYSLYDIYKFYFEAINKGDARLDIPEYNGGLFAIDELLDSLIIDDFILDENVQILSNYDFASEISVNILGHIFEQSLTDLEELQANIDNVNFDKTKSKRKKDGVFYTPEYITRYIVENTLGKMCSEKREELQIGSETLVSPSNPKKLTKQEQQTKENLQEYKNWLLNLKILDPACGSGAFLNQALEYLINEHKNLQNDLALMGDLFASYMVEEEILEHNLYGVDINEDAVEIAKLSLWLRTAKRGRLLTKLVDKIKCGNSLIDDKNVVSNAFVWQEEFKEVFENGGFDVVIGNPPWNSKISNIESINISKNFNIDLKNLNMFAVFFYLANKIIKSNGYINLLVPEVIIKNSSYVNLRDLFINKYNLESITNHGQFPGVASNTVDVCYQNYLPNNITKVGFKNSEEESFKIIDTRIYNKNPIKALSFEIDNIQQQIIDKVSKNNKLMEISKIKRGIELGQVTNLIKCDSCHKYTEISTKYYTNREDNKCKYCDSVIDIEKAFSISSRKKIKPYDLICLSGKEINRYIVNNFYYIVPNLLGIDYKNEIFSNENLFVKRIATKPEAMIINDITFAFNTLYSIYDLNKLSKKSLLIILNSKLISFYYELVFNLGMNLTTQITVEYLKQIPISIPKEEKEFIQKADLMLELNKKLQELKQNFINELNLEKVPTKLQKFEELDFDDFVKEYAKAKKIKFADKLEERNFKNDWQRLFENDKKEVLEIQNQINITDKEIDQMVYKLYDLTEDEIKIVEGL